MAAHIVVGQDDDGDEAFESELRRRIVERTIEPTTTIVIPKEEGDNANNGDTGSTTAKKGVLAAIIATVIVVVIVVVLLPRRQRSEEPTTASDPPTSTTTYTTVNIWETGTQLFEKLAAGDSTVFDDIESPQYQALQWLLYEDTKFNNTDFHNSSSSLIDLMDKSERLIMERYIMAVFYFSTGGEEWYDQFEFLSPSSICDWPTIQDGEVFPDGIRCDDNGFVEHIKFRKYSRQSPMLSLCKCSHHASCIIHFC